MFLFLAVTASHTACPAAPIDWVTVGDPGNAADTDPAGYGAVAESFRIMKYEFSNSQYTAFLNSVAATDTYSLYKSPMGSTNLGGILQTGAPGSYSYSVKPNMGDRPVNYVSWFSAARVANWLQNGATASSSTETGAYTLGGATSGNAPSRNPGAVYYIPTTDQWYKAAFYKGGSTNAGYWDFATQSDSDPTSVTKDSNGNGSAGPSGNFANYNSGASTVTTVGTNGGPSAYGAFDMSGNVSEWFDLVGTPDPALQGNWGGGFDSVPYYVSSSGIQDGSNASTSAYNVGFRLAGAVGPSGIPEIDPAGMGSVIALVTGALGLVERRRRC